MSVTCNTIERKDRSNYLTETQTGRSDNVIEFFAARDQMFTGPNSAIGPIGYRENAEDVSLRRELSHPYSDPTEDWLYSLISAAALVSLLIGILCWPSQTTTKAEPFQPRSISDAKSSFLMQKPS